MWSKLIPVCSCYMQLIIVAPINAGSERECYRDGEVRLEGGRNDYEGTVNVCQEGIWRYMCILTNGFDWSVTHAEVVCRTLNNSTTGH